MLGAASYVTAKKAISLAPGLKYEPEGLRGLWIVGAPGSGKSRFIYEHYPDAFRKA